MSKFGSFSAVFTAIGLFASIANAGIVFGTGQNITADTDISTNGTSLYAVNFEAGLAAQTANGVTFSTFDGQTNVTLSGNAGAPLDGFQNPNLPAGLSAEYLALLNGGAFENGVDNDYTITLNNLVVGDSYEVQVFASRSPQAGNVNLTGATGSTVTLVDDPGQFTIGTFTATAATEDITVGGDNAFAIVNALQVRTLPAVAVPEPGSLALLAVLGGVVGVRRRRRA